MSRPFTVCLIVIASITFSCSNEQNAIKVSDLILGEQFDEIDTTYHNDGSILSINYYDSLYLKTDLIIENQLDDSYSFDREGAFNTYGRQYHYTTKLIYDTNQDIIQVDYFKNEITVVMESSTGEAVVTLTNHLDSTRIIN